MNQDNAKRAENSGNLNFQQVGKLTSAIQYAAHRARGWYENKVMGDASTREGEGEGSRSATKNRTPRTDASTSPDPFTPHPPLHPSSYPNRREGGSSDDCLGFRQAGRSNFRNASFFSGAA